MCDLVQAQHSLRIVSISGIAHTCREAVLILISNSWPRAAASGRQRVTEREVFCCARQWAPASLWGPSDMPAESFLWMKQFSLEVNSWIRNGAHFAHVKSLDLTVRREISMAEQEDMV